MKSCCVAQKILLPQSPNRSQQPAPLIRHTTSKYFLPFCGLSFYPVHLLLDEGFDFDVEQFIDFYFCCPLLVSYLKKHGQIHCHKAFHLCFLLRDFHFQILHLGSFHFQLYIVKGKVQCHFILCSLFYSVFLKTLLLRRPFLQKDKKKCKQKIIPSLLNVFVILIKIIRCNYQT